MRMIWTVTGVLVALSLCLGSGCKKDEGRAEDKTGKADQPEKVDEPEKADEPEKVDEPEKADEPEKVDEPKKAEEPKKVEEPKKAARPFPEPKAGPAYFAVRDVGVVKLDGGKLSTYFDKQKRFKDIVLAPDGTLYLVSFSGVYEVKGGKGQKIGDYKSPGSLDHLALGPDGTLWGTSFKGVARYDGRKWAMEEKTVLGADVKLLGAIAVDKGGTVWVLSSNAVHRKDGDKWTTVDTGVSKRLFYKALALDTNGTLYASHSSGLLAFADGGWTQMDIGGRLNGGRSPSVDGAGHIFLDSYKELVRVYPDGGGKRFSSESGSFAAGKIETLTADASGRVWAGTDHGVVIIDKDDNVTEWKPGTFAELRGTIDKILVVRSGPALPQAGEQATATVKGTLVKAGKKLAGATVEICKRPSSMFGVSPCDEAPFSKAVQTTAEGAFTFEGVPLATYRFAVKHEGNWAVLIRDCCGDMKKDEQFDIGSLTLK